jgi:hypothetical protein
MRRKAHLNYRYHHMGIPVTEERPGEHYSSTFKMYTSGGEDPGGFRVQFHRFDPGSSLHPLIQSKPHVAFQLDDLEAAIEGEVLLLDPYEPFEGFKVAIIEDDGVPIELVETDLSDEEVFGEPKANSVIYPQAVVPVSAQEVINS